MRIYIPTIGRINKQLTVERLTPKLCEKYRVSLVTSPDEARVLREATEGKGVVVLSSSAKGIADTRQWILDYHKRESDTKDPGVVLMLDDDLPTWRQRSDCVNSKGETPYTKATTKEIEKGLDAFAKLMKKYAHGSIGHALFCQVSPELKYNSRMLRALAYNVNLIPKGTKFRLQVMEDFDMELQLLTQGFPSVTYNGIVQDQHQNNSAGGCSGYRTLEVQAAAAHRLKELWPELVTVVTRAPAREWIGMGGERTDVRVNWSRAAKLGRIPNAN